MDYYITISAKLAIIFESLGHYWELILKTIFPDRCLGCGERDQPLCLDCISHIEPPEREVPGVYVCYTYRDPLIRNAIWRLKYKNHKTLAVPLSEMMADFIIEELADEKLFGNLNEVLITSIPQSKKRTRDRGYNQGALIAQGVATRTGLTFSSKLLEKNRETKRQVEVKDRKSRLKNLKEAFSASRPNEVKGKTIIVVDDVVTTGATLNEAKRALKVAGARRVIACALAH